MDLSPFLYHRLIRPQWSTKKYIHDHIRTHFPLENKVVLDFGSGTGANCSMFLPCHYFGIDPDEKRVAFAKRLYPDHTFTVFDGSRIPMNNQIADYILIVAVLHHISTEQILKYANEFQRILKPHGTIIAIEPYLCDKNKINNWFMNWNDNGEYIRNEDGYLSLFKTNGFDCRVIKKFKKCFFYNEMLFSAALNTGEEVIPVTVASQVKTCVASLKSAQASLEQFALDTQNQQAKSLYTNASQQTQQIINQVESRVQQLENEEPQYKGF